MAPLANLGQQFGSASQILNSPAPGPDPLAQGLSALAQGFGTFMGNRKQAGLEQADREALAGLGDSPPGRFNEEQTAQMFAKTISNFGSRKFKGVADAVFQQRLARQADPEGQRLRDANLGLIQARTAEAGRVDPVKGVVQAPGSQVVNPVTGKVISTATPLKPKTSEEVELIKAQTNKTLAETIKLQKESNGEMSQSDKTAQGNKFRTEFNGLSADFVKSRDAFTRVKASAADPSAAGDLALIFNFMKVLDPGSVVRESEFANAAASGSFGERIKGATAKVVSGQRLSSVVRQDFLNRAGRLFKAQESNQGKLIKRYTSLADRFGIDPQNVIAKLDSGEQIVPTAADLTVQDLDGMTVEQLQNLKQ